VINRPDGRGAGTWGRRGGQLPVGLPLILLRSLDVTGHCAHCLMRLGDDVQPLVGPAGDVREERDVAADAQQALPAARGEWDEYGGAGLLSGRRLLPQTVGPDEVQSALINPGARIIIASVTYNGTMRVTRGTVVGGIVEVSAQTGRRCGHYSPSARPTPPTPGGTSPTACCHPSTQPATTCSSAAASSAGSTAAGSPHCPATRWPRALPPGDAALDAPSRKAGKVPAPGALACLARSSTGCAPAPDPRGRH
jgi:hypothetical protein